jgi:hypothetical protein
VDCGRAFDGRGRFLGAAGQQQHLAETVVGIRLHVQKIGPLGELEGLAHKVLRPLVVTAEGEHAADELDVYALRIQVMPLEDVLVTKLHAMGEHLLDYESVLEIARTLREQIDWDDVRERTADLPYARARSSRSSRR